MTAKAATKKATKEANSLNWPSSRFLVQFECLLPQEGQRVSTLSTKAANSQRVGAMWLPSASMRVSISRLYTAHAFTASPAFLLLTFYLTLVRWRLVLGQVFSRFLVVLVFRRLGHRDLPRLIGDLTGSAAESFRLRIGPEKPVQRHCQDAHHVSTAAAMPACERRGVMARLPPTPRGGVGKVGERDPRPSCPFTNVAPVLPHQRSLTCDC
jgi:hypothetical protein